MKSTATRLLLWGLLVPTAACSPALEAPPAAGTVVLAVADTPIGQVDPRYLSFSVDTSEVVGGLWWSDGGETPTTPFDFTRPALMQLTAPLAPAFLRIGGTAADQVYYDIPGPTLTTAPPGYAYLFTQAQYDAMVGFAVDAGLDVLFTLNAGPGPRDAGLAWEPENAQALVDYSVVNGAPVKVWELGNEVNAYPLELNLNGVTGAVYARDLLTARALIDAVAPGTFLAGPASAFWPQVGEINPILPGFLAADADAGGLLVDVVTWHYYPQQSTRCPVAVVPATPTAMLEVQNLDGVTAWSAQVAALLAQDAPHAQAWISETGNAQCGGQAGVSNTFASSFWWLDQLGLLARQSVPVQVRQTLSGADYGLLDDQLNPRPDYWASLLWKQLMGTRVLDVTGAPETLRAYAHCAAGGGGAVSLLAINLASTAITPVFSGLGGHTVDEYVITAATLTSTGVSLNGAPLTGPATGSPSVTPALLHLQQPFVTVPPQSYAFLKVSDAALAACE